MQFVLKETAIPLVNLPSSASYILAQNDLSSTQTKRNNIKSLESDKNVVYMEEKSIHSGSDKFSHNKLDDTVAVDLEKFDVTSESEHVECVDESEYLKLTSADEEFKVNTEKKNEAVQCKVESEEKAVQVEFDKYKEIIRNEKDLKTMTGLPSFSYLSLLENVKIVVPTIELRLCKKSSQFSIKDRIVLTFIKLKQNLSYTVFSIFF